MLQLARRSEWTRLQPKLSVCSQVPEQQPSLTSRASVGEENCACGTLGRLEPIWSPERQKEEGRKTAARRLHVLQSSGDRNPRSLIPEILQSVTLEMKRLNQPLLLSSRALGWHRRFICGVFSSPVVFLKCSHVDFYLFSADAGRKWSAGSRAPTCV